VKVGALEVVTLVDAEGSFATMSEALPSSSSNERCPGALRSEW